MGNAIKENSPVEIHAAQISNIMFCIPRLMTYKKLK